MVDYASRQYDEFDQPSPGFLSWVFGEDERLAQAWNWLKSLVYLAPRIWLAIPFWNAGTTRLDSWDSQESLFAFVHPLPGIPASIAAPVTTAAELMLPVLLVLGLFGRFAALGLATMAAVIYFVIGGAFAIPHEQVPWMVVGLMLFATGPGRISADYAIRRFVLRG